MAGFLRLFRGKWIPPYDPQDSFDGRTVIITGANSGVGFEAAIKFVSLGASRVILAVRDISKGEAARNAIERRTNRQNVVDVWSLDMNSYASIKAFMIRVEQEAEQLDYVLLNAGISNPSFVMGEHGWEQTLQVNTLSTALLGLLMFQNLKNSLSRSGAVKPVLQITSSGTHVRAEVTPEHRQAGNILESYNTPEAYSGQRQYGLSKLFIQLFVIHLANMASNVVGEPDVIVTSVCPGLVNTGLGRNYNSFIYKILKPIASLLFMRTPEEGARALVSGITLGDKAHGKFWQHDKLLEPARTMDEKERDVLARQVSFEIKDTLRRDVPEIRDLPVYRQP